MSEIFVKNSHQGALTAYDFLENKNTQSKQLLLLRSRTNAVDPGSVIMIREKERVVVITSTIHR